MDQLKELIKNKKVIPFVGAGVSKDVKFKDTENAFINWKELLENFLCKIENKKSKAIITAMLIEDDEDPIDYLDVANKIEKALTKNDFNDVLNDNFKIDYNDIDENTYCLAKEIWNLKSNLIITTNYDKVLYNSSNDKNKSFWDIESKYEQSSYLSKKSDNHIVWNLHGHIDRVDNIILTSQKYKGLYSTVSEENIYKSSLHTFKTLISTETLLFIGFSLDDDYVVQQLNDIFEIFDGNIHNHYILLKKGTPRNKLIKNIKVIEYEDHGQPLINMIKNLQPMKHEVEKESKEENEISIDTLPLTKKEEYKSNHLTTLPKQNKKFVGRVEELEKIEEIFTNDSITYIVNGIGGVGKSELAMEYFHKNKDNYNNIAFIELSEDGTSLEDIFISKFNKEKLHLESNASFDSLMQRLQGLPSKNLLLVDNLDTKEDFEKIEILNSNSNFDLLITTRITNLNISKDNQLNLETLNDKDAKELFSKVYTKEVLSIGKILKYLDNHPLFINLTASSLSEEYITVDELILDIENNNIYKIDSEDDKTFEEHLNDRFDRQFKIEENNELKDLLRILAIFPSIEIDFEILEKTITIDKLKVKLQKLVQRGWLNKKDDSYKLHQIIKTFIQKKYPVEYESITFIFDNISSYIDPEDSTLIASQLSDYIPIIESLLNLYKEKEDNHICGILDSISFLYYALGKYKKSLQFQKNAFKIRISVFGVTSVETASSYNLLSTIYIEMNELPKALEYQTIALKLREELLEDKHLDLATSYNNISTIYKIMGELPKALAYQNKDLNLTKKILGDNHPALAISYSNISSIYKDMKELPKALVYQDKALKLREKVLKDKHPDLANSYNNISGIYQSMGELLIALEYQDKAIKLREEICEGQHPDLATSYNNISVIYKELKECKKAKESMEKAVVIWENYDYYKKDLFEAKKYLRILTHNIKKEDKIKKLKDKGKYCKDWKSIKA